MHCHNLVAFSQLNFIITYWTSSSQMYCTVSTWSQHCLVNDETTNNMRTGDHQIQLVMHLNLLISWVLACISFATSRLYLQSHLLAVNRWMVSLMQKNGHWAANLWSSVSYCPPKTRSLGLHCLLDILHRPIFWILASICLGMNSKGSQATCYSHSG